MERQALDLYRGRVQAEWIDYNGHMNLAYYLLCFDKASDLLLDRLDLGESYRRRSDRTNFVLEAHLNYDRELREGAPLRITSLLADADEKRLHVFHEMFHGDEGWRAATSELLMLHVDLAGPRSVPFAEPQRSAVRTLLAEHAALPRPVELGRSIAIRRRPILAP
jgi:acyl-CoA thioester hydrolase